MNHKLHRKKLVKQKKKCTHVDDTIIQSVKLWLQMIYMLVMHKIIIIL